MFANVAIPSEHDTPLSNCFERGEKNYDDVSASPRGYMNPSTQEGAGGRSSRERRPAERLRPPGSALLVAHSKGPGQGGGSAAATYNKGADTVADVGKGGKNMRHLVLL